RLLFAAPVRGGPAGRGWCERGGEEDPPPPTKKAARGGGPDDAPRPGSEIVTPPRPPWRRSQHPTPPADRHRHAAAAERLRPPSARPTIPRCAPAPTTAAPTRRCAFPFRAAITPRAPRPPHQDRA